MFTCIKFARLHHRRWHLESASALNKAIPPVFVCCCRTEEEHPVKQETIKARGGAGRKNICQLIRWLSTPKCHIFVPFGLIFMPCLITVGTSHFSNIINYLIYKTTTLWIPCPLPFPPPFTSQPVNVSLYEVLASFEGGKKKACEENEVIVLFLNESPLCREQYGVLLCHRSP